MNTLYKGEIVGLLSLKMGGCPKYFYASRDVRINTGHHENDTCHLNMNETKSMEEAIKTYSALAL